MFFYIRSSFTLIRESSLVLTIISARPSLFLLTNNATSENSNDYNLTLECLRRLWCMWQQFSGSNYYVFLFKFQLVTACIEFLI